MLKNIPHGLRPIVCYQSFAARLKSCPFKTRLSPRAAKACVDHVGSMRGLRLSTPSGSSSAAACEAVPKEETRTKVAERREKRSEPLLAHPGGRNKDAVPRGRPGGHPILAQQKAVRDLVPRLKPVGSACAERVVRNSDGWPNKVALTGVNSECLIFEMGVGNAGPGKLPLRLAARAKGP